MRRKFKNTTKTLDSFIHNLLLKNYDPNSPEAQSIFKQNIGNDKRVHFNVNKNFQQYKES